MDAWAFRMKVALIYLAAAATIAIVLFFPAGTPDFWQAWLYLAVVLAPALLVIMYFSIRDPEFLERRFQTKEKEAEQEGIVRFGALVFIIGFIIPGLDRRFGWTFVPAEVTIAADVLVFLSYAFIFLVFRANSYAGRTIRVEKGQKVVSTGPYAIVRHPMYLGSLVMYLATPLALGSYAAVPAFLLCIPMFVLRILNEEKVLRRELPGYSEYCKKTVYRLIPFIW
jgi:protein-S-isoprenylcysteine O-methyltransferase Ste14